PRERLMREGAARLSDTELLALFLRTGLPGVSAMQIAREVLEKFGGLSGLFSVSFDEFCAVKGLGPAKFAQIKAILEMTKRTLGETLRAGPVLASSSAVRAYLQLHIGSE